MGPARLAIRAAPGARRAGLVGRYGEDAWKVRVSAPPEDGKANDELCRLLAELLAVPRRNVEVISGKSGRNKLVAIHGIDTLAAEQRLAAAIPPDTANP